GNISYKNNGALQKLIIGDYSLQFGQGLSMWTGLGFGKGAAIASVTKNNIGLKPYTSTNELLFLRGAAAAIKWKKYFLFTPFISFRNIDAGIQNTDTLKMVSSVSQTGFHRTVNEIANKATLHQSVYGLNVQYSQKGFRLGATGYQTRFDMPIAPGKFQYNRYDFEGRNLMNIGMFYAYNWRNMYLFGEAAHSLNQGSAFVNGLMASVSSSVSVILLHRNYQRNYQSFFNQALAESSNAVNEKGFYTGITISPNKKIEWSFYADLFRFPWLKFRVDAPSSGHEVLSQLLFSPSRKMKICLRYKLESKQENEGLETGLSFLEGVKKQNYRLELSYKISDDFQLRNRVELTQYKKANATESGNMVFQDLIYSPLKSAFTANLRFALFDTPGFNSRIYAFENDVLYSYSMPAYQNKGMRFYVNGRYQVNKSTDICFRYAITSYTDLNSIGSGLDKIEGNKKSDIKMQARFLF
ncbi:MAG: hypothetical protein H7Y07_05055, partial [Pyrinomonadaceae bacterium]|nr:hypothetical protein [Sphingobacteriaceae bacterium]